MPDHQIPLLHQKEAVNSSPKASSGKQSFEAQLLRQFLQLFLLIIRVKVWRMAFLIAVMALLSSNLLSLLALRQASKADLQADLAQGSKSGFGFFDTSDLVASGSRVLVDRTAFPAEVAAIARTVSGRGGSAGWLKDCSTESKCRAAFISEMDSSVIAHVRYAKTEAARSILECFSVAESSHRCALLFHLMVESQRRNSSTEGRFKEMSFFELLTVPSHMLNAAQDHEKGSKNGTDASSAALCLEMTMLYGMMLTVSYPLMSIGVAFYFLITTVSYIRIIKADGFYQQLVRSGLSVTASWTAVWLLTVFECCFFSLIFILSHIIPCPRSFAAEKVLNVFVMLCLYFTELAGFVLLMELLVPSIIAISMLTMVVAGALAFGSMQYNQLAEEHPMVTTLFPQLSVREFILHHMASGNAMNMATMLLSDDDSQKPATQAAVVTPKHLQNALFSNGACALILAVLTVYLDFVLHSGNGLRLPLTFPIRLGFWQPPVEREKTGDQKSESSDTEKPMLHIEPVAGLAPCIVVDGISKTYSGCCCSANLKVLHELSCKIYRHQITALIGHNGAGKSSLIKILTGEETSNGGAAYINGYRVTDSLERLSLRGRVSVCPQFDVLCSELTVMECIRLSLACLGVREARGVQRARDMLRKLGLAAKEDVLSTDLSGGQKRKVNTILALLGDPDVVFLDEPTSGLDPVSRRQLWQLLQEEKLGRSIVLCTHFMDEADILADRKIFLCGGKIVCAGSSMFLKRAFGCSFTLSVSLRSEADAQKLLASLPQVKLRSQLKTELKLEVAASNPTNLLEAVQVLERSAETKAFGLSQANLDDIFMMLGGVSSTEVIEAFNAGNLSKFVQNADSKASEQEKVVLRQLTDMPQELKPSSVRQFAALLRTNLRKQFRTRASIWNRFVIPALLLFALAMLVVLFHVSSSLKAKKEIKKDARREQDPTEINEFGNVHNRNSLLGPNIRSTKYVVPTSLWKILCLHDQTDPVASVNASCAALLYAIRNESVSPVLMEKPKDESLRDYLEKKGTQTSLQNCCENNPKSCNGKACYVCVVFYASSWDRWLTNRNRSVAVGMLHSTIVEGGGRASDHRKAYLEVSRHFGIADFENTTALSYLKPLSQYTYRDTFLTPMLILVSLFPVSYLSDPIDDITSRVRNHLISMGMTQMAYWINLFCLHWIQYITGLVIAIAMVISVEQYRNAYFVLVTCLPVLLIGTMSNQLTIYVIAAVTKSANAIVSISCNLLAAAMTFILTAIASNSTVCLVFIVLLPPMAPIALMFFSTVQLSYNIDYYQAGSSTGTQGLLENCLNHRFVRLSLLMMPIHIAVMIGVIALAENVAAISAALCSRKTAAAKDIKDQLLTVSDMDQGAQKEAEQLLKSGPSPEHVLEVRQLTKTYANGVRAVRGVTFGVRVGEIFGLLGANGAGKSTSIAVAVGEDAATSGSVQVRTRAGEWLSGRCGASRGVIGYCPQHNPLFDCITVTEHLRLYADIRGLTATAAACQVTLLLQGLGLQPHKDKEARQLSGGNKRRLCLAIAMLGDPVLVVIDEASTGVDPENKRFIWGAIRGMLHSQRSVMVTTHSMEEVEALCSRVGIMNSGRMLALGTVQQLRSMYGDGYSLDVLLQHTQDQTLLQRKSAIKSAVEAQFKGAAVLEDLSLCMQFSIPKRSVSTLSGALQWLNANQSRLQIHFYALCQMSLDQVFVKLVKQYGSSKTGSS